MKGGIRSIFLFLIIGFIGGSLFGFSVIANEFKYAEYQEPVVILAPLVIGFFAIVGSLYGLIVQVLVIYLSNHSRLITTIICVLFTLNIVVVIDTFLRFFSQDHFTPPIIFYLVFGVYGVIISNYTYEKISKDRESSLTQKAKSNIAILVLIIILVILVINDVGFQFF